MKKYNRVSWNSQGEGLVYFRWIIKTNWGEITEEETIKKVPTLQNQGIGTANKGSNELKATEKVAGEKIMKCRPSPEQNSKYKIWILF